MTETHVQVNTFITRMMCNCGGVMEMVPTNVSVSTYPPQYLHRCNVCGNMQLYLKQYPCIEYKEVEKFIESE